MKKQDGKVYALFIVLMMMVLLLGVWLMIRGDVTPPRTNRGVFAQVKQLTEMIPYG